VKKSNKDGKKRLSTPPRENGKEPNEVPNPRNIAPKKSVTAQEIETLIGDRFCPYRDIRESF